MSRQITELEAVLSQLIAEHRKLLGYLVTQQAAMKTCDLKNMDDTRDVAEACRLRMLGLETRRRALVGQIAAQLKLGSNVTLAEDRRGFPPRAEALLALRTSSRAWPSR